jgi:hypothetical protein
MYDGLPRPSVFEVGLGRPTYKLRDYVLTG